MCKEEDDDERQGEHHACGHQQVPFLTRSGQEHLQADGQRILCAVLQIKQRAVQIVPAADEYKHHDRRQHGLAHRVDDAVQNDKLVRTVDARGLNDAVGQALYELPHKIDVIRRAEKRGQHQGYEGIHQPQLRPCDEQRDLRDLPGDHHCGENERENIFRTLPGDLRQGIGDHRRGEDLAEDRQNRDHQRVLRISEQRHTLKDCRKIFPLNGVRNPLGRIQKYLVRRLYRGGKHPQERHEKDAGKKDQQNIRADLAHGARGFCRDDPFFHSCSPLTLRRR